MSDFDDLEAMLLGGGSAKPKKPKAPAKAKAKAKAKAPAAAGGAGVGGAGAGGAGAGAAAAKPKAAAAASAKRARAEISDSDDDEEEAAAPAAAPELAEAAADDGAAPASMPFKKRHKAVAPRADDSNQSDAEAEDEAEDPGQYDQDGYGDDADRRKLHGMTEIDREATLEQRRQAADKQKDRADLMSRLQQGRKKSMRQDKSSHKDEQRRAAEAIRKGRDGRSREAAASDDEDDSDMQDSADEYDEDYERRRYSDDEGSADGEAGAGASLPQAQSLVLSRARLAQLVTEPSFEAAVKGMFVRISLGVHEASGMKSYALCEIIGVQEGNSAPYVVMAARPKSKSSGRPAVAEVKTHLKLTLRAGKNEKAFYMDKVSNTPILLGEFEKWKEKCSAARMRELTVSDVSRRLRQHRQACSTAMTDEQINKRLELLKKSGQGTAQSAVEEKARIKSQLEEAMSAGDMDKETELRGELETLESKGKIVKEREKEIGGGRAWSGINERNRRANVTSQAKGGDRQAMGDGRVVVDKRDAMAAVNYWHIPGAAPKEEVASPEAGSPQGKAIAPKVRDTVKTLVEAHRSFDLEALPPPALPEPSRAASAAAPNTSLASMSYSAYLARA